MVTRETVIGVAKLAKLSFSDEELSALTGELNSVLEYVDQLNEVEVANVTPLENMNEAGEKNVLRKDEPAPSLTRDDALKNAPRSADGYFLVPKVLAQEIKSYVEMDLVGDEEEELL